MIAFQEIVERTFQAVRSKVDVSYQMVANILDQSKIASFMQNKSFTSAPKRLIVRRIVIGGRKLMPDSRSEPVPFCYDRCLKQGLNGWIAGNGKGKSTILKVIIWAITGVKSGFKPDIQSWIEEISVEVDIDGEVFTIRFSLKASDISGAICACDIDTIQLENSQITALEIFSGSSAMTDTIARFFGTKFGFLPLEETKQQRYSPDFSQKTVSWDIYGQALFISANDYTDYLFPRSRFAQHHQKTLSMHLGLGLTEAISKLEAARNQARITFNFEKKRIIVNAQGIQETIRGLKVELENVEEKIQAFETGQSVLINPDYVTTLREKVALCTRHVADLLNEEQNLESDKGKIKIDIYNLRRVEQELREVIQFRYFLSGLVVEQCPHCEAKISPIKVEEEIKTKKCRVCHNDLRPISSTEEHENFLKNTRQSLSEKERALRKIEKDIKNVHREYAEKDAEAKKYRVEIFDLSRQERAGFKEELQDLLGKQGYLKGRLEQLQQNTEESQSQHLNSLKANLEVLDTALGLLRSEVLRQHEEILGQLEALTTDLAKSFGVPNLEKVWFDKNFNMFVSQSGCELPFGEMDQSERLRLKIAFHLALLTIRTQSNLGQHPAFLIIDAPGSAEMDAQHFHEILQGLFNIKDEFGNKVQILIASTKDDLVEICGENYVDYRKEGEAFF
jgi:hypothetical protein